MPNKASAGTIRSLTFLNTLLLVTAFSAPAFAQIETVVVTAERKSEDIQTVPVSVTALTSKDLKAKQVSNFRDLQFHVPSVTYTKSNFGGAQFQIRGITTQFGLGAAVAQNFDDVYLEAPALVTGEYYDVDRVEVLRGPQSTSYGRAATGGAVNIISAKPNLDEFEAKASVDYGTFQTIKPDGMINIPIIDGELGVRLAAHASFHDGYEKNIYTQIGQPDIFAHTAAGPAENSGNNLGVISGRGSIRWQPSDDTTVDLVGDVSFENDRRTRGDKQECHFDPAGVAGCLPDRLGFEPFNTASTLGVTLGSAQGIAAALSGAVGLGGVVGGAGLPGGSGSTITSIIPTALSLSAAQLIGNTVGLCSVAGNGASGDPNAGPTTAATYLGAKLIPAGPAPAFGVTTQTPQDSVLTGPNTACEGSNGIVSPDVLKTNTAFNPKYKTYGGTYLLNWSQTITDWLKMTVDAGFADGYAFTQQDFTDATHENISGPITSAQNGFDIVFGGDGYNGVGGVGGLGSLTSALTTLGIPLPSAVNSAIAGLAAATPGAIAHNADQYDAAYFDTVGSLPLSNIHHSNNRFDNYGGIIDNTRGGVLLTSPYSLSYDEDWFASRETTGEARFQSSFKGPLNFSAGLFYMTFDSENQYWVAANSLDWQSAALGAFLTPCSGPSHQCSTVPYMLAMPAFDAEYRRGFVQSRSAFLEGTWEITDELKLIAGARYNDDRDSLLRASKCAGGGLFAVNAVNPSNASGPCDSTQFTSSNPSAPTATDPNCTTVGCSNNTNGPAGLTDLYPIGATNIKLPLTTREPTFLTGKKVNTTDLWTGRVSINWSPKLDFTDQTFVYFTASRGELAGGINTPNNGAQTVVPVVYKPAIVDSLELGIKNTLLDNSVTANLTAWYYNYQNYQVVVIANRQALELNIPANLYGLEGEFLWAPTEDLAFNMTISATHSAVGNVFLQDQRNLTNNVHGAILVKDLTNGSNCVVTVAAGNPKGLNLSLNAGAGPTPGDSAAYHVDNFYLPNGGDATVDAVSGIPLVNYGICGGQDSLAQQELRAKGFDYTRAINPRTGLPVPDAADVSPGADGFAHDGSGFARNLHGNRLPQIPFGQVGVGGQYTFHIDDFNLVPRVDYYFQTSMQSRAWNDPVIDRINSWDVMNAQVQFTEADSKWYFQVFAKNIFDKHNPTGQYLQDPAAGLYTNVFAEDPRVVGFSIGDSW
jgi:outer membrane receptor protein involved in Fe transport